jgi:hypothetical protein
MPNPEPWVPGTESQNPKPGSCDLYNLIIELPSPETWNSSAKCQTPNTEPRVPGAKSWNLELGTQGLGFRVRHLAPGTKIWEDQKNLIFTFLIDICPVSNIKSQVPSSEFQVSGLGTRHPALGVWHLALGDNNLRRSKNLIYTFLIDTVAQKTVRMFWCFSLSMILCENQQMSQGHADIIL